MTDRLLITALVAVAMSLASATANASDVAPHHVTGDAIREPLRGLAGDAARGALVVKNRETGNCLICHAIPDPSERFQGEIGPPLAGVGLRLTEGQIRLRLVDPTQVNPKAIMPAYHRVSGFINVDQRFAGVPVLNAQDIEDVVAYLMGLKE